MIRLNSNIRKLTVLLLISIGIFVLWQITLQEIHAHILMAITNSTMHVAGSESKIVYEVVDKESSFWVHIVIEGQKFRFPQEIGSLLQPTVMILAWQLFLFFILSPLKATRLLVINLLVFIVFQVFFLIQLTGYHTSAFQKFLYELMVDSFYVIALIFIIKDSIFNPVFMFKKP